MDPLPLPREFYDRAKEMGVSQIVLNFQGGSDEGYIHAGLRCDFASGGPSENDIHVLTSDIEDWAYGAYAYNGAGDGNVYGDIITYDLELNKVGTEEWWTTTEESQGPEYPLMLTDDS